MSALPDIALDEVVVLVGNPRASSRTSTVARAVGAALCDDASPGPRVIEIAGLREGTGAHATALHEAHEAVRRARLLVVATPVYKASFTGVLKSFVDGLAADAFESTVAVPVVLTGSSGHGVLADLQLRTVLQAAGALLPVPSFVLEERHLDELPQHLDAWRGRFGTTVAAVVRTHLRQEVGVR
jgi:FMN reductase